MNECMHGRMNKRMKGCINEGIKRWRSACKEGWINKGM